MRNSVFNLQVALAKMCIMQKKKKGKKGGGRREKGSTAQLKLLKMQVTPEKLTCP